MRKLTKIITSILLVMCISFSNIAFASSMNSTIEKSNVSLQEAMVSPAIYNRLFAEGVPQNGKLTISEYNRIYDSNDIYNNHEFSFKTVYSGEISAVKTQTKDIVSSDGTIMGSITLQYQTYIAGGRPQFVYESILLSHPRLDTYWMLDSSHVDFTGDKITVHFNFSFSSVLSTTATAVFKPL